MYYSTGNFSSPLANNSAVILDGTSASNSLILWCASSLQFDVLNMNHNYSFIGREGIELFGGTSNGSLEFSTCGSSLQVHYTDFHQPNSLGLYTCQVKAAGANATTDLSVAFYTSSFLRKSIHVMFGLTMFHTVSITKVYVLHFQYSSTFTC